MGSVHRDSREASEKALATVALRWAYGFPTCAIGPMRRVSSFFLSSALLIAAGVALAQSGEISERAAGKVVRGAVAPLETTRDGPVYRIPVTGTIDNGLAMYIDRAVGEAEAEGATAVVLQMDTYGGLLDAADKIRKRLLATDVPVIAVIDKNAASAGALISYAADRILVTPGASMGAATAVDQAGEYAPEKVQSYTRGLMRTTAEATGRDPRIAEAMVDESISIPGVVEAGKLLTLSAEEAVSLGVAEAEVASVEAAVSALGLGARATVAHEATTAERLLRLLGSPVVASILMLLMMGGLYFELQTPGIGVAGAAAVIGAALFFAPHYLLGLVESWEIALFVVGVGLLAVEVFVVPGFGVFGVSGIAAVLGALLIALVPNVGFQFPTDGQITQATATLAVTLVLLVALAVSLARYLPQSTRFQRFVLQPDMASAAGFTSADTDEALLGKVGEALTTLRPAGTASIDGCRVDVVAEGAFVKRGTSVEVVSVRGSRVVVRARDEA